MWSEYQRILETMKRHGFITHDELVTSKGRMSAALLAPNDALSLVECWFNNLIPKTPDTFLATLSCFLCQRRHNQPETGLFINNFHKLEETQSNTHPLKNPNLGTSMINPVMLWMKGCFVSDIVQQTDISPGHFCKEILRLAELLRQLKDAAVTIGDPDLVDLCAATENKMKRGLPFVESMKLQ